MVILVQDFVRDFSFQLTQSDIVSTYNEKVIRERIRVRNRQEEARCVVTYMLYI